MQYLNMHSEDIVVKRVRWYCVGDAEHGGVGGVSLFEGGEEVRECVQGLDIQAEVPDGE